MSHYHFSPEILNSSKIYPDPPQHSETFLILAGSPLPISSCLNPFHQLSLLQEAFLDSSQVSMVPRSPNPIDLGLLAGTEGICELLTGLAPLTLLPTHSHTLARVARDHWHEMSSGSCMFGDHATWYLSTSEITVLVPLHRLRDSLRVLDMDTTNRKKDTGRG